MRLLLFLVGSTCLLALATYNYHFLTLHSASYINQAFIINVSVVTALAVLSFLVVYFENKRSSRAKIAGDKELVEKHVESAQSKKMLLNIMEDLEEQKNRAHQLTAQLDESLRDIQNKNNEMEQFIYTISHDLKSPLVSIGGFTSMLLEALKQDLSDKQKHYFSRILANISNMESMLGELLALSRLSRQSIEKERVDLADLLQQITSNFEVQISTVGGSLATIDPLANVFAHERLLQQCLSNLIANAVAYRSTNRALKITIDTSVDTEQTMIRVHDNGIGIDDKYFQTIFRIFEHLNSEAGTGVGLTIVKSIMEKHGGYVSLTSEIDKGSVFCLHFPNENTGDLHE